VKDAPQIANRKRERGRAMNAGIDFDSIRARNSLPEYCERRGIQLRRSGGSLVGKCPLHNEHHGDAFVVFDDGHWRCFGKCGKSGDVVDLEQALRGGTLAEAAGRLGAEPARISTATNGPTPVKAELSSPYKLTKGDLALINEASETLRRRPELALKVRSELPLQAVEQAAIEGDLGFCRDLRFGGVHGPALLFGFTHGIKARWPGKVIRWICGSAAGECWRQSLILKSHRTIYFTEGEVDALQMIDQSYDVPGEALVIAIASASVLPDPRPFRGKEVVIIPDADDAGRKCAEKLTAAVLPLARSVAVVNLDLEEADP
jgi:CHC2 zinc finger